MIGRITGRVQRIIDPQSKKMKHEGKYGKYLIIIDVTIYSVMNSIVITSKTEF